MLLYGNLANPSSLFAYVKAGATTACVSMYVFWTHACVLIPKTRFPSNHVSKTLYPKTERILQVRACRNFRGSFEHRNCAIVHVHLELRLQHWKIFGYVTTPYPTAYIYHLQINILKPSRCKNSIPRQVFFINFSRGIQI